MRIVFAILLSSVALAGCGEREADPRGVDREEALVQIVAAGRADNRPDEARFTAGVSTIGPTAAAASTENAATINRVIAALEARGVRRDDVQTRSITVARIEHGRDRGRFQASNMIAVRLRNVERAGEAIAAATDAGANVLSGPDLHIADPEAATRSAYAAAYRAARARAEAYAEAAGMTVARVLAIRDSGESGGPRPDYRTANAAFEVAPPPPEEGPMVRPGVTTNEVRVRVDFALAPR
jgi:hypothetical protein